MSVLVQASLLSVFLACIQHILPEANASPLSFPLNLMQAVKARPPLPGCTYKTNAQFIVPFGAQMRHMLCDAQLLRYSWGSEHPHCCATRRLWNSSLPSFLASCATLDTRCRRPLILISLSATFHSKVTLQSSELAFAATASLLAVAWSALSLCAGRSVSQWAPWEAN